MGLFSYIARLRQLPATERRQIAVTWTLIIVGVIALLWIGTLIMRFGGSEPTQTVHTSGLERPY